MNCLLGQKAQIKISPRNFGKHGLTKKVFYSDSYLFQYNKKVIKTTGYTRGKEWWMLLSLHSDSASFKGRMSKTYFILCFSPLTVSGPGQISFIFHRRSKMTKLTRITSLVFRFRNLTDLESLTQCKKSKASFMSIAWFISDTCENTFVLYLISAVSVVKGTFSHS